MSTRLPRSIQAVLLASLVVAVSGFTPVRSVAAISSTPTYVLGVSNLQDPLIVDLQNLTSSLTVLGSVSGLSLVSANSILYVDGSWLASVSSLDPTILSLIDAKVLAGVPTVTVRGSTTLLSSSISRLIQWHVPGLTLISEGLRVAGSLPDGTKISSMLQVVSGFDSAVQEEFNWANNLLGQASAGAILPAISPTTSHSIGGRVIAASSNTTTAQPYWQLASFLRFDNPFPPYGRLISTFTAYQLENSGSSHYGWYNLFFNQTIMPGIMIYNTDWRTSNQYQLIHVLNTTSTALVDHGPTNVNNAGPFVVSYSTGVTAGVLAANVTSAQSQSYALKNTNVTDTSQPPDVSWVHAINSRTSAGTLTFTVTPGVTIRYLLTSGPNLELGVATTFVELSGNSIVGSKTITYGMFPG